MAASVVVVAQLLGRTAGSGDLSWMLAPTAALGAGLRFLTLTFVLGFLSTLRRLEGSPKRWAALAGLLGGAYVTAILANAARIAGAILVLRFGDGWCGWAKSALHLAEGIVVFASYLVLYFLLVHFAAQRSGR